MLNEIKLPKEFIEQTKQEITPHWGPLGWVTYKRTYARWIEEEGRSEEWHETVQRVVEGNINLDPRLNDENYKGEVPALLAELQKEAEDLFRLIYGLAGASSGRNLWISGTDFQKRNGDSLNNCWFISIRPQKYGNSHIVPRYLSQEDVVVSMPYSFIFDQLMKGGGVGFSVVEENVEQMPDVAREMDVVVVTDESAQDYDALLEAGARDNGSVQREVGDIYYRITDDREGWVEALAHVIDAHYEDKFDGTYRLVLDVSDIRPKGAKIKGFGGVASGAMPLVELLYTVNEILNAADGGKLTSVEMTDIANLIGKTVVAGNVRRSAEIALGSPTDSNYITMKQDASALQSHRWASNNSVIVDSSFNDYDEIADSIIVNGEPGIVNMELSKDYGRLVDGYQPGIDGLVEGTNPCGEISLENGENCNLFEVFPLVAEEQGWDLKDAFALATRYSKRVTFSNYEWEVTREVIQRNRRLGISMSGIQDWVLRRFGQRLVTGFNNDGTPIFNEEAAEVVNDLYHAVRKADYDYSDQLGVQASIKVTTVKPSGTVSKLAGVSEGIHFHYDKYLIQRIRFQSDDPILQAVQLAGYKIENDVYSANTKVVEFLFEAPSADVDGFISAGDVSIEEQFATQAFFQTFWSDNSVSCTITFREDEREKIAPLFYQYKDITKSTSLLPFSGHGYVQAPKEPIDKETFEKRVSTVNQDVQSVYNMLQSIRVMSEQKDLELVGNEDCATGACPVK